MQEGVFRTFSSRQRITTGGGAIVSPLSAELVGSAHFVLVQEPSMRIQFNQLAADGLLGIIRTNPIGVAILGTASHDLWINGSARLSAPGSPARIAPGEFEIVVQTEGELKMLRKMVAAAQKQLDEKRADG